MNQHSTPGSIIRGSIGEAIDAAELALREADQPERQGSLRIRNAATELREAIVFLRNARYEIGDPPPGMD